MFYKVQGLLITSCKTSQIVGVHDIQRSVFASGDSDLSDSSIRTGSVEDSRVKQSKSRGTKISITSIVAVIAVWFKVIRLCQFTSVRINCEITGGLFQCAQICLSACGFAVCSSVCSSSTSVTKINQYNAK